MAQPSIEVLALALVTKQSAGKLHSLSAAKHGELSALLSRRGYVHRDRTGWFEAQEAGPGPQPPVRPVS